MDQPPKRADAGMLADRYVLHEPMGSGGAGVVWRAHDRVLDRVVAVKLLHADVARDEATASRFRAEATAAAKLTHPHAVIVYDIGRDADRDYLVMELVEGATLAELLAAGPLPPAVVATIGEQVARALGAAHARGLVHRDVKPANVLITDDGVAKVADFGIARALGESTSRLTTPGHVMGTARYLAPEQLRDVRIDARADVYALGLVLHQAVTGQLPFGDGTAVELASRRLVASLTPPSQLRHDVPPGLDEAIARATRLDPGDRFADGSGFAAALANSVTRDVQRTVAALVATARPGSDAPGADADAAGAAGDGADRSADVATTPERQVERTAALSWEGPTTTIGAAGAASDDPGPGAVPTPGELEATDRHRRMEPTAGPGRSGGGSTTAASAGEAASDETVERGGRRPLIAALILLAVVVASVAGALSLIDTDDDPPVAQPDDEEEPAEDEPPADDPAPAGPLQVVDGGDHDPLGDGEEHPADVPNAFDGDPGTTWQTQRYQGTPDLGGLKPGVGIWLDLGDPAEVEEVVIGTTRPGADLTLFVGDAPPDPGAIPEEWGEAVATVTGAAEEEALTLDPTTEGRVWLLWFTSLPADGGGFAATVSDVSFTGS